MSVIVPTWNRAALLSDCLASLKNQDYPPDRFEIIVVDDGSSDHTANVAEASNDASPSVRYIYQQHRGLNAARNAGIAAAKGDPICFVDDESDVPPGWLRAMMEGVARHPHAGCLGGPIRLRFEKPPPRICDMETWESEGFLDCGAVEKPVSYVKGGNLAIREFALARVGTFSESPLVLGDETEWQERLHAAGIPIMYIPEAWNWHRRPAQLVGPVKLLRRRFLQGRDLALSQKFRGHTVSPWHVASPIPFYLFHALRRACFGAILQVSWKLGIIWGTFKSRREGR